MTAATLARDLERATGIKVRLGAPAAALTTFLIGGPLACLVEPESEEQLAGILRFLHERGQQYLVLGGGSNLLVSQHGIDRWVIRLGRAFRFTKPLGDGCFEVGGSMSLMSLAREVGTQGFAGLEFAGGIPASMGGAVRMNAGAHGGQMADVVTRVALVLSNGEMRTLERNDLTFAYRASSLPEGAVVTRVGISLVPGDRLAIMERRAKFLADRKRAQPLTMPSAGSIFKNPFTHRTAGILIEQAGLKGRTFGGAGISEKHGNWIVNVERKATADDVRALIELCKTEVERQFDIRLETELVMWV